MGDPLFHNDDLSALCASDLSRRATLDRLAAALDAHGTLRLSPLPSGLYVASDADGAAASGYRNVWVRDNVYVALAQRERGRGDLAAHVAVSLLRFYGRHRTRFTDIISGTIDAVNVMKRPHVRFDGTTLEENRGRWPHAQNDALGYCLWLCGSLARQGIVALERENTDTLACLVRYFDAIQFWTDEDSGHWEETRKVSASSIGTVVAGLREWRAYADADTAAGAATRSERVNLATDLMARGLNALHAILPSECVQPSPPQHRRHDASLLFLIHPLGVVTGPMADRILGDVSHELTGHIGIRRYPGDSYWAPDYDVRLASSDQTRDFSDDLAARDALLERRGEEAQWCIFDPMLSALYGQRYLAGGTGIDRKAQAWHFTRAVAQVTTEWRCPELYYLRRGAWVSNPHTPLLWTQANLRLALSGMRATAT